MMHTYTHFGAFHNRVDETSFLLVVTVDFGSPTYTVPEDGGSVQVCLRTNVGSDGPLTLTISTAPKSATREFP